MASSPTFLGTKQSHLTSNSDRAGINTLSSRIADPRATEIIQREGIEQRKHGEPTALEMRYCMRQAIAGSCFGLLSALALAAPCAIQCRIAAQKFDSDR